MSRRLCAITLALGAALGTALGTALNTGCGKAALGRHELEASLARHYLDLRWGRIPSAAQYVAEDLRPAFLEDWTRRAQSSQIQDFDIVQIVDGEDGERAEVYIALSWVEQETLSLKSATLVQTWIKTDAGWRAAALLELEVPRP